MADNQVQVEISIEEKAALRALTQLSKGVESFEKQTEKSISKADVFFANFAANIATKLVFGGFDLASKAISVFRSTLAEGISLAQVQEDAINKLNSQLARTGEFSQESSKDFQDYASSLQAVTKFGDEVILGQLAIAKAFGANNEQAKSLVTASADLAESLGVGLDSAVKNLSKTLGGQLGELGELVPELKNFTKEQLQAGAAIDFVAQKFQGVAANATKTFSGALTQTTNIIGDTKESLGLIVTQSPVVVSAIGAVGKIFGELNSTIGENSETIRTFAESAILQTLKGGIEFLVEGFIIAVQSVNTLSDVIDFSIGKIAEFSASTAEFLGKDATAFEGVAQAALNSIAQREAGETQLVNTLTALKNRSIEIINTEVEAARTAKDAINVVNQERLQNEVVASEAILAQRRQAQADLDLALLDQKQKEIELNQVDNERRGEERIAELQLIQDFEIQKAQIQLDATIAKNQSIEDAEARALANKKALIDQEIAIRQAQVKSERAQEAERDLIRQTQIKGLQANIQAGIQLTRQGTAENKALQIANAVISTYSAANLALANPPGPPFTIPLAAAAVLSGLANVQRIQAQSYATGGVFGGFNGATYGGDNMVANVRTGEMALNASQQKTLFSIANGKSQNSSTMDEIRALASQPVIVQVDGREVARAVRNQKLAGYQI